MGRKGVATFMNKATRGATDVRRRSRGGKRGKVSGSCFVDR